METLMGAFERIRNSLVADWKSLFTDSLHFEQVAEMMIVLLGIVLAALAVLLMKRILKKPGRKNIFLPAILPVVQRKRIRFAKCLLVLLFLNGFASYCVALADPQSPFGHEEITTPGKRIALLVDASGSMTGDFAAKEFKVKVNQRYYTAIAASEYFVKLRMKSNQRDLISLVEFATFAYVVTPFTNDYKTILTNLTFVGDPEEWRRLNDSGTYILTALYEGLDLFRTYGFLESTGNAIVLISDGEDNSLDIKQQDGKTASFAGVIADLRRSRIPIFFIRTRSGDAFGGGNMGYQDAFWKDMCEKTGGRFFAADNEGAVIAAAERIDKSVESAMIKSRYYTSRKPHYRIFAAIAVVCWTICIALWGGLSCFRQFP